jgi:hypothetical protein
MGSPLGFYRSEIGINIKKKKSNQIPVKNLLLIFTVLFLFLPDAKNSDCLLTKEKGLLVLHLEFTVLPGTMNCIILEHVCLRPKEKQNILLTNKNKTEEQGFFSKYSKYIF